MKKKFLPRFAVLAVCTFVLTGTSFFLQPSCADAAQPNIILINVDNMGWGDLCSLNSAGAGCEYICTSTSINCTKVQCNTLAYRTANPTFCTYKTEELDKLASGGVTLTNFYTPVPICTPSRAALMTGHDPLRYDIIATPDVGAPNELPGSAWTLAEEFLNISKHNSTLKDYNTAIIGKWQLGFQSDTLSWAQGFEYNYVLPMGVHYDHKGFCLGEKLVSSSTPTHWQYISDTLPHGLDQRAADNTVDYCSTHSSVASLNSSETWRTFSKNREYKSLTGILTKKAIDYIDDYTLKTDKDETLTTRLAGKPFFIYLAYPAPHATLRVHLPTDPDPNIDPVRELCQSKTTGECKECTLVNGKCEDHFDQDCTHQCELDHFYDAVIKEMDTKIGELLTTLQNTTDPRTINENPPKSLKDTTIIIFTSDNGPFIGQGGDYFPLRMGRTGGMRGGQKHNFEGGVRVPFIAYWKGHWENITDQALIDRANKRKGHPADMMDIFTTLVSAAGGLDQYADQNTYVGVTGTKCNDQLTVTNNKGDHIALDGKDISSVLTGNDTCLNYQKKDIHTTWILADTTCTSWSKDRTSEIWTLDGNSGKSLTEWMTGWTDSNWKWWVDKRGCCYDDKTGDLEFGMQYPFAIRSYDPTPNNTGPSFVYKQYLDEKYGTTKLFDLGKNFGEKDSILEQNTTITNALQSKAREYRNKLVHNFYLPSIKDDSVLGWENWLTVMAKLPISMDVKLNIYDMKGVLKGTYIYSDTDPRANELAIKPNARVAARPSLILTCGNPQLCPSSNTQIPAEGSMIIETNSPAIVTTNTIANNYQGFDIYEAPTPHSVHTFTQAWDGPNRYQAYILIQNIYNTPRNVTIKLFGKNKGDPGDGATKTVDIQPFETYKVRPSEIAVGIDFSGTVIVSSNLNTPGDGLGPPLPAVVRYENGTKALAIYASAEPQPALHFPHMKDGKFGGTAEYKNYFSIMNPGSTDATVTVVLYNVSGVAEGSLDNEIIPAGGKKSWRPSWIKGTLAAPLDFEGSIVINTNIPVVGQTNALFNPCNTTAICNDDINAERLAIYESVMPASVLYFPKAYDNIIDPQSHLFDNYVYIQNPDSVEKDIKIELFNNDGPQNGGSTTRLAANATYVFRPKNLVADGTGKFRGSVKVTETNGNKIAGVFKYEVHTDSYPLSYNIEAITIFRPMGQ